jgi:hypothetical protein
MFGRLLFLRSLFESAVLWFFNLRVVNVQTVALWVLLGFLDVREGRSGVFRDNVYWWIGFFVDNHGYWEMSGEGGVFRACVTITLDAREKFSPCHSDNDALLGPTDWEDAR